MANSHRLSDEDFDMFSTRAEQRTLFASEDLVIPESLRNLKKAVGAVYAVPTNSDDSQSLTNRRVFDGMIMVAQIDCRQRGKDFIRRIREERISPMFEVRTSELARISGIPGKNLDRVLLEARKIYAMSFDWSVLDENKETLWDQQSRLLTDIGLGKNSKRGHLRFAMNPDMLSLLLEPSHWAAFSLSALRGMGTSAAYALFQATWRFVNREDKATPDLPTKTWIELMVGKGRYTSIDPSGKEVINYGEFKRRILSHAVSLINEVQALSYKLELREHKQGNRVAKLSFKFLPKPPALALELPWSDDLLGVLSDIGFSDKEINEIGQAHSMVVAADALLKLEEIEDQYKSQGKPFGQRKHFYLALLRWIASGEDDIDLEKIEKEVSQEVARRTTEERATRLQAEYESYLNDLLTKWLQVQDPKFQTDLWDRLVRSDAGQTLTGVQNTLAETSLSKEVLAAIRGILIETYPEISNQIYSRPESQSFDAWMMWKLTGDE